MSLTRLNLGLAGLSFTIIFTLLFTFKEIFGLKEIILYSLFVSISLALKGFISQWTITFLEKRYPFQSVKFKRFRYLFTLLFDMVVDGILFVSIALINDRIMNVYFLIFLGLLIILINVVIIVIHDYIILIHLKTQADIENARLKNAQAEAVNQLLRQQIQPHFLFNALNTLKSLYKIDPTGGEKYIVHLSDFLRASFSNSNTKITPVKEEIKLCMDYLEMQKIRFGHSLQFEFNLESEIINHGLVPSFSIQPLIENAIKHNELTLESPLQIAISSREGRIRVTNNIQLKPVTDHYTGSGLTNLTERYRLLCQDDPVIEKDEYSFSVSIKVIQNEDSNH